MQPHRRVLRLPGPGETAILIRHGRRAASPHRVMAKSRPAVPELFDRAAAAADAGDLDAADRLYRSILAVRPGLPQALYSLSIVRFQRGRHTEALSLID